MIINELGLANKLFGEINAITLDGEGITRPSYSPQETAAMRVVERHAMDMGLTTSWDHARNLHVMLKGRRHGLLGDIVTGSHLDTVPNGGRYDGTAGVVAGLLALNRLIENPQAGEHDRTYRLIVFRGEESAWFGKCYLGSTALFGRLPSAVLDFKSPSGFTLGECISKEGGDPSAIARAVTDNMPRPHRFYEVHIEQGPVLHEANLPIGIVTSIRGNRRYRGCRVIGESAHSGTTPRRLRKDPVLAFADLISRLDGGAKAFGEELLMTCGVVGTDPKTHAISAVASEVTFDLEFRSHDRLLLDLYDSFFQGVAASVIAQHGTNIIAPTAQITAPVKLDERLVGDMSMELATIAVRDPEGVVIPNASHKWFTLPSGAGHDAAVFQDLGIATGMIFIRNEHGSHNPRESMHMDDFMLAAELLYRTMLHS